MTEEIVKIDGITFKIFRHSETEVQELNESKNKGRNLVATFTYDIHKPHNPTGEYHIHLRDNGNEILSMNKVSGTAHDGYHGVRIPNKAFKSLKDKLPDWNWPSNQILESLHCTFFLNDISELNEKHILNEIIVIKGEISLFDMYKSMHECLDTERSDQINDNYIRLENRLTQLVQKGCNNIK